MTMLEKILDEIKSGGTFDTGVLAQRLNTTPELVKVMLEQLQRIGYIHPYEACTSSCDKCGLKAACSAAAASNKITLWQS